MKEIKIFTDIKGDRLRYAVSSSPKSGPATLDEKTRSVGAVAATETPVREEWDEIEYGLVLPTVVLMSGCQLPPNGQIPLLDSHDRTTSLKVIGSARDLAIDGDALICRAYFDESDPAAVAIFEKYRGGHLTDFSVGRKELSVTYIPEGLSSSISGKTFDGPMAVVTSWQPRELSACPVGADINAKVRTPPNTPAPPAVTIPPASNNNPPQENRTMNLKTRSQLVKLGMKAEATDEEAIAYLATVDFDKLRSEAAKEEYTRVTEISAMLDKAGIEEDKVRSEILATEVSVDVAGRKVAEILIERSAKQTPPPAVGTTGKIEHGKSTEDKFRAAATDALAMRSGLTVATPADGATMLQGFTVIELMRESLRTANKDISGTRDEIIKRSLSTSDLPTILGNIANKSMFAGFDLAKGSYATWADTTGTANDFKEQTIASLSEADDLLEVKEGGEILSSALTDDKQTVQIKTFARNIPLTRQAIINDDLSALTSIRTKQATAYDRLLNQLCYGILTANAAMADAIALFAEAAVPTGHANYDSTGAAPSKTTLTAAFLAMALQRDVALKQRLNIRPKFFLAPAALEGDSEDFFNSRFVQVATGFEAQSNRFGGNVLTRVYDALLDDTSAKEWYLLADKGQTVKLFFLNGSKVPRVETEVKFGTGDVIFSIAADVAAAAVDWRGMFKNNGE